MATNLATNLPTNLATTDKLDKSVSKRHKTPKSSSAATKTIYLAPRNSKSSNVNATVGKDGLPGGLLNLNLSRNPSQIPSQTPSQNPNQKVKILNSNNAARKIVIKKEYRSKFVTDLNSGDVNTHDLLAATLGTTSYRKTTSDYVKNHASFVQNNLSRRGSLAESTYGSYSAFKFNLPP